MLAGKHSIAMEPELESASWLTPWAAEFRYDDAPTETLDRKRAITVADAAVSWCQGLIADLADHAAEPSDPDAEDEKRE
jgi:hypothetical protein